MFCIPMLQSVNTRSNSKKELTSTQKLCNASKRFNGPESISKKQLRDCYFTRSDVPSTFGPNHLDHIIVATALNHVFQNDIPVDVLQVDSPAGNFIDIGPIDRLFNAPNSVQSRLGKGSSPMTLVILKFCESLHKLNLQLIVG